MPLPLVPLITTILANNWTELSVSHGCPQNHWRSVTIPYSFAELRRTFNIVQLRKLITDVECHFLMFTAE